MNEKLLLVNGITLMYRAKQLQNVSDDFAGLVQEIVSNIKLPELSIGQNGDNKLVSALRTTALSLCNDKTGNPITANELLQRLRVDCGDDNELFDAFERGIFPTLDEQEIKSTCLNLAGALKTHLRNQKATDILSRAAYKARFEKEKITDFRKFIGEIYAELEPYQSSTTETVDPAIVTAVNMSNVDAVAAVFTEVKSATNGEGLLRTGFQGINRMLNGGIRPGMEVVIGALQHNYKTGFSLTLFKQIALYNTPKIRTPGRIPLLLRISFEDDVELNMQFLFRSLRENEFPGEEIDLLKFTEAEIAAYVTERLRRTGFEIELLRVDPTQWTYRDIINYCLLKEAQGYEIHLLMVDYLKMIPTTGCTQGAMGQDVRDLFRRIRNFCAPRKITMITPHQLSTEAKMLIREGKQDFVRELPGKGYYDSCRTIDNEVDLEIFIHIEKVNGQAFLTVQRGKHRIVEQTPEEFLYCALPFRPNGGILDDINGPDSTRKKPGGGPIGSTEENTFWDFA